MNKKIDKILEEFNGFTDGVRMLMLCHRNKEGGSNNERNNIRRISRNNEEFVSTLEYFFDIKEQKPKIPYRIYSCLNKRDPQKAIRLFKYKQLDAEYNNQEEVENFYFDIKNRWISSLMKPQARLEKNFLIDIDEGEDVKKAEIMLINIIGKTFKKFKTKNGYHLVSPPFNPSLMDEYEINKDGLLLLDY
jgi:hypothetical protein